MNNREVTGNREIRTFVSSEMRVVRKDGESPKIVGHAAVFNSPTRIGFGSWGFMESVAPGAFKESIKIDDIRALFNHDPNLVLGRNTAGTLELKEDKKGLEYEIDPPDTQTARDLLESIDRKDITGSSFGFEVQEQRWTEHDDDIDERELLKLKLFDVSPVTFPAYDDTDVSKRQYQEFRASIGASIADDIVAETRPFENEHACRLRDPADFKEGSFRRTSRESDGKKYDIISGRLKDETEMTEQAYRYGKDIWTVSEARKHCEDHDGILFEPAESKSADPGQDSESGSCCGSESKKDSENNSGQDNEFRSNTEQMGRRLRLED